MRHLTIAIAVAALGAPALAQDEPESPLTAVYACADLTDDAARLACYDAAVGNIRSREEAGEVAVVDREQVARTQREAFGFRVPSLSSLIPNFSSGNDGDGGDSGEVDSIQAAVADYDYSPSGMLRVELANGQTWEQIDPERVRIYGRGPFQAEVRRASMGSYQLIIVGRTRAIRVRRVE